MAHTIRFQEKNRSIVLKYVSNVNKNAIVPSKNMTKIPRYPIKTNVISPINQHFIVYRQIPSKTPSPPLTDNNKKDRSNHHDDHSQKKCPSGCMSIGVIAVAILIGGIVAAIVVPVLTITHPTTKTPPPAVLRWNPNGVTIAGVTKSSGTASNKLNLPWDIFVDQSYTVYVTDRFNSRVQRYFFGSSNGSTVAGRTDGIAGKSAVTFNNTSGVLLDSSGNLYVADMFNHRVQFFLKNNSTGVTIAGNGSPGSSLSRLNMPHGLDLDPSSSTLYIADAYNHRIMRCLLKNSSCTVAAGGNGQGTSKTKLFSPHAIFYHSSSNSLLIANYGGNNIVRWALDAKNWTLVAGSDNGTSGKDSRRLNGPTDVMLDAMGNLYVADRGNHRIQFFLNGQLNGTTIAGITSKSGGNATMLSYPNSIALDNQLNLYVVDHYNHRIQKFLRY